MKTNFKRLFALVLTLCMLASLMVPVAFAEDEAIDSPAASVTVAETYPIRLVDMTNPDHATATGYSKWFKGGSGWKNIAMSTVASNLDTEYAADNLNWRYIGTNDSKYMYYPTVMMQPRLTDKNTWAALQIRVSEGGRYALNLHTDKTADSETETSAWTNVVSEWKGDVTAYIFPLADLNAAIAAGTETNAAVEGLMTEANCVGTQTLAADATDVTFDKVRMEEGEYVVVYSATAVTYSISEMTLLEDAADAAMYETEQVVTYPIRFADPSVAPENVTGLAAKLVSANKTYTKNVNITGLSADIASAYDANILNWKFLAATGENIYRYNCANNLRVAKGIFTAIQIKVDNSGYYSLTVGTDRRNDYQYGLTNGFATTAFDVTGYMINANELEADVTADNIAALAASENSVGVVSLNADVESAEFERTYLEKGEYVVVFSLSTQAVIKEFGLAQRKIDIPVEAEGAGAVTQHIEVNARDLNDGTPLANAGGYAEVSEYVNTAYAAGELDWKIEGYADKFTDANFTFIADKGMKAATPADSTGDWFALRMRVKQDGNYSLNLKSAGDSAHFAVYMFPAAAETMSAEAIAAQMIAENGIYFQAADVTSTDAKISAGYLEGEYILVFQSIHASKSRTIYIDDIILQSETFTTEDVQFYNFNVFDESNTGYYELINQPRFDLDSKTGAYNPVAVDEGQFNNYIQNADGTYAALYTKIYQEGYPTTLNWRPDAVNAIATDASSLTEAKYYYFDNVDPAKGNVMRVDLSNNKSVGATQYGSFMLRVDKAGTYDLNIKGGAYDTLAKIYFVDSFVHNVSNGTIYMTNCATIADIFANGTGLVTEDYVTLTTTEKTVGQVTVETAGDYLIVFETKDEPINQDNDEKDKTTVDDICLTSITLNPVIEEESAVRVGNVGYETIETAVAAAQAGQTITLQDNIVADEVSLGAGVTLNLNGYALNADSVDAIAPGAQIIDSGDGVGKLRAAKLELSEDNAQLPLYNGIGDYYVFYNVEVESCATTGKINATKYWFKIHFSNEAALDMIGADTELRIMATMSGVYAEKIEDKAGQPFAAKATADAAFSYSWAANSNAYIVLSSAGSNGIEDFVLNPAIEANGVIISGGAMVRGV